jgi:hypothetical protein
MVTIETSWNGDIVVIIFYHNIRFQMEGTISFQKMYDSLCYTSGRGPAQKWPGCHSTISLMNYKFNEKK